MIPSRFTSEDHRLLDLGYWPEEGELEHFFPNDPLMLQECPPPADGSASLLWGIIGGSIVSGFCWLLYYGLTGWPHA